MTAYRTSFEYRTDVLPDVAAFAFERPEGYAFEPGQYFTLALETAEGRQAKAFTHATAPDEPDIVLATRLTGSAFKRALEALRPGDEVEVRGPAGKRALPAGVDRAAFLAGGVGITPARAVLRDAALRRTGLRAVVFYGNQEQHAIPFADELAEIERAEHLVRVVNVIAAPAPGWDGETGFITADLVRRHLDDPSDWHFVVAGPPAMVDAMDAVLAQLGVRPEDSTVERFTGYGPAGR